VYVLDVDSSGKISVEDGPITILDGCTLYGDRMRPIRASIARMLFMFSLAYSIATVILEPSHAAFLLIAADIVCLDSIRKWERREAERSIKAATSFMHDVASICGYGKVPQTLCYSDLFERGQS
jgi:hypothetical protein